MNNIFFLYYYFIFFYKVHPLHLFKGPKQFFRPKVSFIYVAMKWASWFADRGCSLEYLIKMMLKSKKYTLVKSFSKNKGLKIINFVCRYVAYVLPQTFAVEAIRGILLRGWGLSYMPVYRGFLVTIAWIIVTFAAFKKIVMNQG